MVRIVRILQIDEQDGIKCFGPATVYRGTDFFLAMVYWRAPMVYKLLCLPKY